MRSLLCVLTFGVITSLSFSQTAADRLAGQLSFYSSGTIDEWRYSTDFTRDPTGPSFNDASWKILRLNESLYVDSCWIRRSIAIPGRMLGEEITGPLRLTLSVDDYGYMWINGVSKGQFPWDGDFLLTERAKPGEVFSITIKAINTGGPLRLIHAQVNRDSLTPLTRLAQDVALGLRVGQKLLSFDTYQTNARKKEDPGIDRSRRDRSTKEALAALLQRGAAEFDTTLFRTGSPEQITNALNALRTRLAPVAAYARSFTLFFDANAHIDAAWLWREKETIAVCRNTFASVLNMMAQRPDFTYTQSSALYYAWMEQYYPDLFAKMQEKVREGRWEIVGGMWVEPDCNLPSGESWARQLLYAKRYFRKHFSTDVRIGWNPDSFGYNWNMPMFYANAGITAFITQKIGWNDTNVFPYRVFWWDAPDGSRILSYFPFDYVNTVDDPFRLVDWLRQFEANTGFTSMLILFGVGDHGGGPSLAMLDRIDRLRSVDIFPRIEYGTTRRYLDWLMAQDLSTLPVWNDELYLEYHRGTFTTQAAMKQFNRTNETILTNAEKYSTLATLYGRPYHASDMAEAWKKLLFTQFHDILPGSSIHEVYVDARRTHTEVQEIGSFELRGALRTLASEVGTASIRKGEPLVVFNSLGWKRTDLVRFPLPEGDRESYAVFDMDGKEVPSQLVPVGKYTRELVFIAREVPPLGYRTYNIRQEPSRVRSSSLASTPWSLENNLFSLRVDSASGWLTSIVDKQSGKELLHGDGNRLQLLEDRPAQWDAWNIGLTGEEFPTTFRSARLIETGPVRSVLRLERDYLKPGTKKEFPTEDFPTSFFTQDIVLYNGLDRIDFVTTVDWWEEKTMLKVAFPLTVTDSVATYEIPYGSIQRSTRARSPWERGKTEVPAARWADVSAGGFGVSLLNTGKYGYDVRGDTLRLSLLRSPKWPDPMADRGLHTISYSLYPHGGTWESGGTVRRGYEVNTPLLPVSVQRHSGPLPATYGFISLEPASLNLTSVKKGEDSDDWVLQWYNTSGRSEEALLTLPRVPKHVALTDFLEESSEEIPSSGRTVRVTTAAKGVVTVRVRF